MIDLELFVTDGPLVVGRLTLKALSIEAAGRLVGELHTKLVLSHGGVLRP